MKIINKNFSFNFSITVISSLLAVFLGLITGVITARILGPTGRGELGTIQLYGSLAASILTSGLPIALTYFSLKYNRRSSEYFFSTIFVALILAIFITPIFYFSIPYLLNGSLNLVSSARLYLWYIPLGIMTASLLAYIQGLKNILLWNVARLLASLFWLFPILAIFLLKINLSSEYVAIVYLISLLGFIISLLFIVNFYCPFKFNIKWKYCINVVKYGMPNTFYTFSQLSNTKLDFVFISFFFTSNDLGLYIIALSWSTAHLPLTNAVSSIILPHLSDINDIDHKFLFFNQTSRINSFVNIVVALCMILISPIIIPLLFGKSYTGSVQLSMLLIFGTVFSNLKLSIGEALRSVGLASKLIMPEVVTLICAPVFFFIFSHFFDIYGIALGYMIINLISLFYVFKVYHTISGYNFKALFVLNKLDILLFFNRLNIFIINKDEKFNY